MHISFIRVLEIEEEKKQKAFRHMSLSSGHGVPQRVSVYFVAFVYFLRFMAQSNRRQDYKASLALISELQPQQHSAASGVNSWPICFMLSHVVMVAHFKAYCKI